MAVVTADGRIDQASVNAAVAATVATAGRAVFFSGLTVLLGLIGLILFEFMVLRSVGIAGAAVVGLGRGRGRDAPAGRAGGARAADRLVARCACRGAGDRDQVAGVRGRLGAPGPARDGPPAALLRADAAAAGRARLAVPARPPQRARRVDPAARRAVARRPTTCSSSEFGEGEFAPLSLAVRTSRPGDRPAERRRAVRLLAPPGRGSARVAHREHRRRRSAPEPRAVPAAVRRARWTGRSLPGRGAAPDDEAAT